MLAATASASADPAAAAAATDTARRAATFRRHTTRTVRVISASYVADGLVLMLFVLAGTVGWRPVALYTALGLGLGVFWGQVFRRGWSMRMKDPHMPLTMSSTHLAAQCVGMLLMPQLSFMFLLILFIIFTSLAMRATPRQTITVCVVICSGVGIVLGLGDITVRIPDANLAEQLLATAFVGMVMWQCIWLGSYNGAITRELKRRSGELAALTAQVKALAHHDELTGLLNRRSLLAILEEERKRAERSGAPLSVALIDIDRFKHINDTFGHPAGDRALKALADTVLPLTRNTDRLGRYGGEEFLVILTHTSREEAAVPIDRFRDAMNARGWDDVGTGLNVTFSCGIASFSGGEGVEDLVRRADEALYRAKHDGRNCTRLA